jgi:uncharacterized protein (DUF1499 family)
MVIEGSSLVACPDSPNCVSSQADPSDEKHYIEPLTLSDTSPDIAGMATWMAGRERCEVLDQGDIWLHATCSTAIFKWTDDIALLVDSDAGVVHVRSASRVGKSDLGANRKRVEAMRTEWNAGL